MNKTTKSNIIEKEWNNKLWTKDPCRYKFRRVWENMIARCTNPRVNCYKNYGGRGIKVLWKDFSEFAEDMYPSYIEHYIKYGADQTTIERINNDDSYYKDNCTWADRIHQQKHRRNYDGIGIMPSHNHWVARFWLNKQIYYIGTYDTAEKAKITSDRVREILRDALAKQALELQGEVEAKTREQVLRERLDQNTGQLK